MRQAVRDKWYAFTIPLEGSVGWLYQDVKGLVSIGIGNLVDPISLAIGLPFVRIGDNKLATREEIEAEWHRVKNQPPDSQGRTAAQLGHNYAKQVTTLRLMDDGIRQLVDAKLAQNDRTIAATFLDWEEWPADAQLATHSMAWACGAGIFNARAGHAFWPKLTKALLDRDFRTAAIECFMPEEKTISGLRPRNKANRILYNNAAVVAQMFDPAQLYWPTDLDAHADTEPAPPSKRPPQIEDFTIVHPDVPVRGHEDDE